MPEGRHGPNKLPNYTDIHRNEMHRFLSDGFELSDGIELRFDSEGAPSTTGQMTTNSG
ncbi:MAG: hypothetical protein NTU91_00960 [Chloroflexi bacterium]|nr:hypothetical protein [Chloroflexota bacterium]